MQDNVADKFAEVLAKHACRALRREKSADTVADILSVLSNPMVSLPALGAGIGGIGGYYSGDDKKSKKRNAMWGGLSGLLGGGGAALMTAAAGGTNTPPPGAAPPGAATAATAGATSAASDASGAAPTPAPSTGSMFSVSGSTTDPQSTKNWNIVTPPAAGVAAGLLSRILPTDPLTRWIGDRGQVARMLDYIAPATKGGSPTRPFASLTNALKADGKVIPPRSRALPRGVQEALRGVANNPSRWGPSVRDLTPKNSPNWTLPPGSQEARVVAALGNMAPPPNAGGGPRPKPLPVHAALAAADRVPKARLGRSILAASAAGLLTHTLNPTLAGNLQNWLHDIRFGR